MHTYTTLAVLILHGQNYMSTYLNINLADVAAWYEELQRPANIEQVPFCEPVSHDASVAMESRPPVVLLS